MANQSRSMKDSIAELRFNVFERSDSSTSSRVLLLEFHDSY